MSQYSGKIESGVEGNCVNKSGALVPLEHFDYGNEKLGCLLKESLQETFFLGISVSYTTIVAFCKGFESSPNRKWCVVMAAVLWEVEGSFFGYLFTGCADMKHCYCLR